MIDLHKNIASKTILSYSLFNKGKTDLNIFSEFSKVFFSA